MRRRNLSKQSLYRKEWLISLSFLSEIKVFCHPKWNEKRICEERRITITEKILARFLFYFNVLGAISKIWDITEISVISLNISILFLKSNLSGVILLFCQITLTKWRVAGRRGFFQYTYYLLSFVLFNCISSNEVYKHITNLMGYLE